VNVADIGPVMKRSTVYTNLESARLHTRRKTCKSHIDSQQDEALRPSVHRGFPHSPQRHNLYGRNSTMCSLNQACPKAQQTRFPPLLPNIMVRFSYCVCKRVDLLKSVIVYGHFTWPSARLAARQPLYLTWMFFQL